MLRREMESAGISIQNAAFLEQHVGTVEMIYLQDKEPSSKSKTKISPRDERAIN